MLVFTLINLLVSNALASNKNKSILYSRTAMVSLLVIAFLIVDCLYIKPLKTGLGIYNGIFNVSILSLSFILFITILTIVISMLTSFYPRKKYLFYPLLNATGLLKNQIKKDSINKKYSLSDLLINKSGVQFTILEYSLITIFVLCGAALLISTGDLVALFLSIELQSYGLYIISTIYRDSESATNSGLIYFLLGGLSSCFILLGSAILYVNSGNTNLDNIYIINSINELAFNGLFENIGGSNTPHLLPYDLSEYKLNYINFSFIILTVGLLFKISAAPFHFWSPDVYDGIPTIVTTFVAIVSKISLLVIMLELITYSDLLFHNTYEIIELYNGKVDYLNYQWKNIIVFSSLMSLLIGSILGLTQSRIKRLFAYSTINHIGFILLTLCVNKIESIQGYIFYILQYSISNLNAFFILIIIGYTLYEYILESNNDIMVEENIKAINLKRGILANKNLKYDNAYQSKYIDIENSPIQILSQIKGYFYVNSFLSISFIITLFSFVGIPPLIGFFAKQVVLSAALNEGYVFMTIVAIITSVISAAYYLNIVKLIFFDHSDYKINTIHKNKNILYKENFNYSQLNKSIYINDKLTTVVSILTMLILLFVFVPDEWFRIANILSLSSA